MLYTTAMPRHEPIKVHLKRYRLARDGMSQQELAERVGVTRQTIISIERGKYHPSIDLALRLARAFDVPVEALFELNVEESPS
jgi:putative transcriptional regulator